MGLVGTIGILFSAGLLELFSLGVVIRLFTSVQSKEVENLRWISKVGNNKNAIN